MAAMRAMFRSQVFAMAQGVVGNPHDSLGTGLIYEPVSGMAIPISVTPVTYSASTPDAGQPSRLAFAATLDMTTTMRIEGRVLGVNVGSCTVTHTAQVTMVNHTAFSRSTAGDLVVVDTVSDVTLTPPFASSCSLASELGDFFDGIEDNLRGIIAAGMAQPLCRAPGATEFSVCPAP